MENIMIVYTAVFMIFAFIFIAFGVFSMGFLIGYKNEENKSFRKKQDKIAIETDKEKKAKKDWKKFLEYDGSMPYDEKQL